MPVVKYELKRTMQPNCVPITVVSHYSVSNNSPRVNGKLLLKQQNYRRVHDKLLSISNTGKACISAPLGPGRNVRLPPNVNWAAIDNRALARYNGRLRKGSASLGVTLASWKQSQEMIVHRSKYLVRQLDYAARALSRDKGRLHYLRRKKDPVADEVLELEFGWLPLFQDLHACLNTVVAGAIPPHYVKSRHREFIQRTDVKNGAFDSSVTNWSGFMGTTLTSQVQVSNPNLWLLNRMGLINPATIMWDLVPWSFVVNMFLNVNQMINSITDTVGLTINDKSTTRTSWFLVDELYSIKRGDTHRSNVVLSEKTRIVGSHPSLSWELKVPDVNWELAVIAASLVVQRFDKLNRLIRF